jgi:SAM-dependent methyltransferase
LVSIADDSARPDEFVTAAGTKLHFGMDREDAANLSHRYRGRRESPPRFDAVQVRRYYDRHTATFMALGRSGSVGAIHRAVWGPGVETRAQAFHYVDEQIATLIRGRDTTPDRPHVVDLGCGVGATLCYLAKRLPIRATGVTISPVQARLATTRIAEAGVADRVTCLEGSYEALPPSMPTADLAYAIESFAHAQHPERFFAECQRLVRRGGLLVICDDFRRPTASATAARAIGRFTRGWHLNALLTAAELHALAAASGFAHESTVDLSPCLEPLSLRDRVLDTGLGWLSRGETPLGPVLGGAALQKCLARGWTAYEFVVFRRVGDLRS